MSYIFVAEMVQTVEACPYCDGSVRDIDYNYDPETEDVSEKYVCNECGRDFIVWSRNDPPYYEITDRHNQPIAKE